MHSPLQPFKVTDAASTLHNKERQEKHKVKAVAYNAKQDDVRTNTVSCLLLSQRTGKPPYFNHLCREGVFCCYLWVIYTS